MQPRSIALASSPALWLALTIALVACEEPTAARGRVLLIGTDGATLRIARPLLDAGRLPHLAAIAQEGVFGPLRSHFPLTSPRIWASIATGKLPDKHGIKGFARLGEDGQRHLYESRDRRAHALWSIASAAGLRVGVVNWWTTYPLEKINGVLVSDHLLPQELAGRRGLAQVSDQGPGEIVYPLEWSERVAALLARDEPLTRVGDPFADPDRFPEWILPERLSQRFQNDADVVRIARVVDREIRPDLLMVFLPGIDRVSHRLWFGIEPPEAYQVELPVTAPQKDAMAAALRSYYEYTDALIGVLAEGFGPDDLVMVVSDHGFEAGHKLMVLTGVHDSPGAIDGVFFARGPRIGPTESPRVVSVNDIAPTILKWLGLPIGQDMDGRPAPFVHGEPARVIASHDTTPIEFVTGSASGAEAEILDQLQALGYFEGDPVAPEGSPSP